MRPAQLFLILILLPSVAVAGDEPPPAYEEFIVIPLRVHVLTATDLPEVDCALTATDVGRIVGKVNGIWHRAGIHWGLESIVWEPAARQGAFRLVHDLNGGARLGTYRILIPEDGRRSDGLHVYYVHRMPVNGVFMGEDFAIVQETARLRPVEGGIDEPLPRVTAHELGHALDLPHRQDRTNLLASGTTGTSLNQDEVIRARAAARKVKGAATVADVREAAEEASAKGSDARALRLWSWLADVPGEAAIEARHRRDALSERQPR